MASCFKENLSGFSIPGLRQVIFNQTCARQWKELTLMVLNAGMLLQSFLPLLIIYFKNCYFFRWHPPHIWIWETGCWRAQTGHWSVWQPPPDQIPGPGSSESDLHRQDQKCCHHLGLNNFCGTPPGPPPPIQAKWARQKPHCVIHLHRDLPGLAGGVHEPPGSRHLSLYCYLLSPNQQPWRCLHWG